VPRRRSDDVIEIEQLLYRYALAIDAKDWKALETVFTPDARIHYAVERGAELTAGELGSWLARAMRIFKVTQHVVSNPLVELKGDDTARCTSYLTATHLQVRLDGTPARTTEGSRYLDTLVRASDGWRIASRKLERVWVDGEYLGPDAVQLFD
jgi:3-phenylpropionate/cinnamic acid dioxygenase small subunit